MRIALASCDSLPDWEVDDLPLHRALRAMGVDLSVVPWTDPAFPWGAQDGVLVRTTWDYTRRLPEFLAWVDRVASACPLFNPAPVLRWNTTKTYLAELAGQGIPVAPTTWLARGARPDLGAEIAALGVRRAFAKPVVGATAEGTRRLDRDGPDLDLDQAWLHQELERRDMMLQPYLDRVEREGEVSLLFVDGALAHAVRKLPRPGDYRVQDDFGASDGPMTPDPDLLALGARIVAAAEARLALQEPLLYARVDLLFDGAGAPVLTELELVEPSLFLRHSPQTAERLARALCRRLGAQG